MKLNNRQKENFKNNHKFIAETNTTNLNNNKSLRLEISRNSIYSFEEFNNMYLTSTLPVENHNFILKSVLKDENDNQNESSKNDNSNNSNNSENDQDSNDESTEVINASPHLGPEVDWRDPSLMNPIREQQSCGSCWAFSSIAALETRHAILNKELFKLSEQELIDCDTTNMGCDGGLPDKAFRWAMDHNLVMRDTCP